MTPRGYTEDSLVEQPEIELFGRVAQVFRLGVSIPLSYHRNFPSDDPANR